MMLVKASNTFVSTSSVALSGDSFTIVAISSIPAACASKSELVNFAINAFRSTCGATGSAGTTSGFTGSAFGASVTG